MFGKSEGTVMCRLDRNQWVQWAVTPNNEVDRVLAPKYMRKQSSVTVRWALTPNNEVDRVLAPKENLLIDLWVRWALTPNYEVD